MESLPFRYALELLIIFLPILFHAVLGVYIVFVAKNNVSRYGFFRNWMFFLQRITGIITLIFIVWHVWQTRIQIGLGNVELDYSLMEDILSNPAMFGFYILGVVSTTFHFANGLWSFLVSWGNYSNTSFTKNRYICNDFSFPSSNIYWCSSIIRICIRDCYLWK